MTCDTWGGGWTFAQNLSFLALTVWDKQCFEDISTKDQLINGSVSRTAPATPGLLNIFPTSTYFLSWLFYSFSLSQGLGEDDGEFPGEDLG